MTRGGRGRLQLNEKSRVAGDRDTLEALMDEIVQQSLRHARH